MELNRASETLTALGHPGRLSAFRLLARRAPEGVRPSEIADALQVKPNTLSVYLATLERAGLIHSERQGKSVFYTIDMSATGALIDYLAVDCCRGRPDLCATATAKALSQAPSRSIMPDTPYNALFICTGNSARSIFAEVLLRDMAGNKFVAYSAGTNPNSELNPFAIDLLKRNGFDTSGLRSKTVAEFQTEDAPKLDFVFTVCDRAANEECPPWPGQPITAHWGLPDPVKATGTEAEKALAFSQVFQAMRRRLAAFTALQFDQLDRLSLQRQLDDIGQTETE
ncbi:arsenate reductase/protein-tyrosine-phosphatase family protein [Anianabacter salinae]|uniref:arsenate reductase/protein-tyrosine-phosphatase family protein n=1 Tax=Anianabacter salinae TaxID=2851023 RepID=UPI00225E06AE|nr:helix-turn-helix domain-containing protein [Anianabacter salinae]MBV0910941.1 helix-turn-helix domain-containing protein [Anianabacter salinae]